MGFRAELLHVPDAGVSVGVLCNRSDAEPEAIAREIARLVLADQPEPPPPPPKDTRDAVDLPPQTRETMLGTWALTPTLRLTVGFENDAWFIQATGQPRVPAIAVSETELTAGDAVVAMAFSDIQDGRAMHMRFEQNGRRMDVARVLPVPEDQDLADFAGTWFCPSLDLTWVVKPKAEGLRVKGTGGIVMLPVGPDQFEAAGVKMSFSRGADGDVDGLSVDVGARATGILFEER